MGEDEKELEDVDYDVGDGEESEDFDDYDYVDDEPEESEDFDDSEQEGSDDLSLFSDDSDDSDDEAYTEDRINSILKMTSDAYTRKFERIELRQIGFTDPIKKGRKETMIGLTQSIKDFGVLDPIDVMTVENPDEGFKYILISGLRRVFGALKNGQTEIDAIVWDFKDKDQGSDLALYLGLLLNRTQKRNWGEIWHLYQILELQSAITPGTLEYLLQLESGDAMKLKDVMLCPYDEVKETLLSGEKPLDACYKMLAKLRKEEDRLALEDAMGAEEAVEGADEISADNTGEVGQLSDQDVMELLEMTEDLENLDDISEDDFDSLNTVADGYVDQQKVGERNPLDPALRQAVLARDDFTCSCCKMRMIGSRLGLIAIHHLLPVHVGGKDTLDNLTTLCLNCHVSLHIMERNGGSIMMGQSDFEALPENEQISLRRALKLARVAIEADRRKGLSKADVKELTRDSIRHPMPGVGLKENQNAYAIANHEVRASSVEG